MNWQVVFRPDVGAGAGLGHLRRCLSLAIALRKVGVDCFFEINESCQIVEAAGFRIGVADKARAFVVDSYRTTSDEFAALSSNGAKVIAIDDVGDRIMPVDLVINPGIGAEELEYEGPRRTALGVDYALLRPEFADEPNRAHPARAKHLLITMGGADSHDLTPRLVKALAPKYAAVDVIIGPYFSNSLDELDHHVPSVRVHRNPLDIRGLMLDADVALTGGGQTIYELAATATPAAAIEIAPNQRRNMEGFSKSGVLSTVGRAEEPNVIEKAVDAITTLAADRETRAVMGANGRRLVDGQGAERVAKRIVEQIGNV